MGFDKVVVIGGGVLGVQIGLMSAYTGHDTTFWLRSEGSIGRTTPKIERYSQLMLEDLAKAKYLIGNPMGAHVYPRGLIKSWKDVTAEEIDALLARTPVAHHGDELAVAEVVYDKRILLARKPVRHRRLLEIPRPRLHYGDEAVAVLKIDKPERARCAVG